MGLPIVPSPMNPMFSVIFEYVDVTFSGGRYGRTGAGLTLDPVGEPEGVDKVGRVGDALSGDVVGSAVAYRQE